MGTTIQLLCGACILACGCPQGRPGTGRCRVWVEYERNNIQHTLVAANGREEMFSYFVAFLGDDPAERDNLPKGCAKGIPMGPLAL